MKSRIYMPSQHELATKKRLRAVSDFFSKIEVERSGPAEGVRYEEPNWLPDSMVKEIADYVQANSITNADLMAIRQTPTLWHHEPEPWLWILHRYTNRYSK